MKAWWRTTFPKGLLLRLRMSVSSSLSASALLVLSTPLKHGHIEKLAKNGEQEQKQEQIRVKKGSTF